MKKEVMEIINNEHPTSKTHKRMSEMNRAAQFAPFAALTGFDTAIFETARLTLNEKEVCQDSLDIINDKLSILSQSFDNPIIKIKYFENDRFKKGGTYKSKIGQFYKLDINNKEIIFLDKTKIKINKIYSIESNKFDTYNI